jgi:transglutaminase-like putative cysteine protease
MLTAGAHPAAATVRLIACVITCVMTWIMAWGAAPAAAARVDSHEPSSANSHGVEPRFEIVPAPDWVVDVEVPDSAGVGREGLHDGVADLLSDTQVRIGPEPEHTFNRYVSEVVEPSGVSSVGRIQIEFAATYQTLELHWIRLVRDGVVQERLDTAKVRLIQQEGDIDLDMYHQTATALVLLDDVRVGDRVDYAYSIVGANPIFGGRYQDWLYLEWWYPFGRIHHRIVAPADRPLYFEPHNTEGVPEARPIAGVAGEEGEAEEGEEGQEGEAGEAGLVEYVWQADAVPAAVSEDETPADYDPLAAHQVSEFETWGDVARWASGVFDLGDDPGPLVRSLADEIRAANETPEARIIAALRFVQDEVRYLGLEIGVNAYRPHSPAVTLSRRFGDCKDKSSLFVALLGELGVEAQVALVNTELGPAVADLHPTASAFDHAIVRVQHEDRAYWLDPTASYERGPLEDEEWFDYGFALVVDPAGEALTVVEPHRTDLVPARVRHEYTSVRYEAPTQLTVTSTYRGDRADSFRGWAASTATDAIERQYQNYYARDMPDIEPAAPIRIVDDETTNTITVTEQYRVPGAWEWNEDKERWQTSFVARELRDELSTPETVKRDHPLATSHPVRTELSIHIDAPEAMRVHELDERIAGPAFTLDYAVRGTADGQVVLEYTYVSTADRVAPRDVAAHIDAVDEAWSVTEYRLGSSRPSGAAAGELDAKRHPLHPQLRRAVLIALGLTGFVFFVLPAGLLRLGLRRIERGEVADAARALTIASRAAPARSVLGRRVDLALSVALGLWGREDEAQGIAARLSRLGAGSPGARMVRSAAWAWRAVLAGRREPEAAEGFADRAVDLARELPGVHGWMARACALSARSQLRAARGAVDAAARDLDEARSHRSDEGARVHGWAGLLRTIASTERAAVSLAGAAGDANAAVDASAAYLLEIERSLAARHPLVIEARLLHADMLEAAGRSELARDEVARARADASAVLDEESPQRALAARLHSRGSAT